MVTKQRISIEDFERMAERKPALEFVDGKVIQKVSPDIWHAKLQPRVWLFFERALEGSGFEAFTELRHRFGEPPRSYVPDVSVVKRSRILFDERDRPIHPQPIGPDVAVEVLSPRQNAGRLLDKLTFYMEHGVRLALVIDPEQRRVTVYEPGEQARAVVAPSRLDLSPIAAGLALDLEELFASLDRLNPNR